MPYFNTCQHLIGARAEWLSRAFDAAIQPPHRLRQHDHPGRRRRANLQQQEAARRNAAPEAPATRASRRRLAPGRPPKRSGLARPWRPVLHGPGTCQDTGLVQDLDEAAYPIHLAASLRFGAMLPSVVKAPVRRPVSICMSLITVINRYSPAPRYPAFISGNATRTAS